MFSTSKIGVNLIAGFEGFSKFVYVDQAGYRTIGYGHKLRKDESYPKGITIEKALELLAADVSESEHYIRKLVLVDLNQSQFDALVSLTYNIGSGNFSNSTLLGLLNKKDYKKAAEQFLLWNKITVNGKLRESNGLTERRKKERELFLTEDHN